MDAWMGSRRIAEVEVEDARGVKLVHRIGALE